MDDMPQRLLILLLLLPSSSFADIIQDIRGSLAHNNSTAAEAELQAYRAQHGVTPEYLEALSWMARGSLEANQLDHAESYAKQTGSNF
jgi:hypothetical protein